MMILRETKKEKTTMATVSTTADEVCKYAYEGNYSLLKLKVESNNEFATKKDSVNFKANPQ